MADLMAFGRQDRGELGGVGDDDDGGRVVAGGLDDVQVNGAQPVSYTHLRAHETVLDLVCRLLLEKKT